MTKRLFNKLCEVHPSLRTGATFQGDHFCIEKIESSEADAMILDIKSIIWTYFEGKVKDAEYTYCREHRYFTCRAIPETATVIR